MDALSNKAILTNMVERKAGNILDSIDSIIEPIFSGNPAIGKLAMNFVTAKKKEWLPQIQSYCDVLVETSCLDPDVTLEQSIINAESQLNEFITELIGSKLGLPAGTVMISLQTLFGDGLFKL